MSKPFLGLMAMARNECQSYAEWIAHHREQGVEHFYIIDNDSDKKEQWCHEELQRQSDVTLWTWRRRSHEYLTNDALRTSNSTNQPAAYEHFRHNVTASWLARWDVDEFAFGVAMPLAEYLRGLPAATHQLCMPWITYGSSFLVRQPVCVTEANVLRMSTHPRNGLIGKCVQRTEQISLPLIHRSVLVRETPSQRLSSSCICADGAACCGSDGSQGSQGGSASSSSACRFASHACLHLSNESMLAAQAVRLHHYISQSQAHMGARSWAGEADLSSRQRTPRYWKVVDATNNKVNDTTLAVRAVCRGWQRTGAQALNRSSLLARRLGRDVAIYQ